MGRFASDTGGGDFKPAPEGTHMARCVELIDIGTQAGEYQGKPTRRNQVIVRWELPKALTEDGKPLLVSKFYTNSLGEKANLLKDLTAWRGKKFTVRELNKFDLMSILGKPCMVTVVHNENGKAKVTSVSGVPEGVTVPPQVNPSKSFWIEEWDGDETSGAFASLPTAFQDFIRKSEEYEKLDPDSGGTPPEDSGGTPPEDNKAVDPFDDDLPF